MRAHLYRTILKSDGSGPLAPGASVRVLQPDSTSLIVETLYADDATEATLNNPLTLSGGVLSFYLAQPQRVRLGVTAAGSTEVFYDDIDVILPRDDPGTTTTDGTHPGSGSASTKVGSSSLASGFGAVALGDSAEATGDQSTALGSSATATDYVAVAVGRAAEAGSRGTAVGGTAFAGVDGAALGTNASAFGAQAVAVGTDAAANGDGGTAVGNSAEASASDTTAVGTSAAADSDNASAFGRGAYANDVGATALGSNSNAALHGTAVGWVAEAVTDAVAVGKGARAHGQRSMVFGDLVSTTDDRAMMKTNTLELTPSLGTGATQVALHASDASVHAVGVNPAGAVTIDGAPLGVTETIRPVAASGASLTIDDPATTGTTITRAVLTANCLLTLPEPVLGGTIGRSLTVVLTQDGSGGRTAAWTVPSGGILWANGYPPTQTPMANKTDVYTFMDVGIGSWLAFVAGQNF